MTTLAEPPAQLPAALAAMVAATADGLAQLLALGLLEHVGDPHQLPELLAPHLPAGAARDRAMFTLGAVVATAAARRRTGATRTDLVQARELLAAAGDASMDRHPGPER